MTDRDSLKSSRPSLYENLDASQQSIREEWRNMSHEERLREFGQLKNRNDESGESLREAKIILVPHHK
jgi:hypothetical protein